MEDDRVYNSQITASSTINKYYAPSKARLNLRGHGGWTAAKRDRKQWLQVDLGIATRVKRIAIQGRYNANYWTTSFTVSYSNNGVRFYPYMENKRLRVSWL